MEQQDTLLLSERALNASPVSLEDRLRELLELKRNFAESLCGEWALNDEGFAMAAFRLMQGGCRLTNADGASLYSSKRQGYLDRQAFCFDPNMDIEQMRATAQMTEHVAVGDGIAGFMALDATTREAAAYQLKYPIQSSATTEVWDIRLVDELPEKLRHRTAQLSREGTIDIASMFLIKSIGVNGPDLILQWIRKRANGRFSDQEMLIAEWFAEMIFPYFRVAETTREKATGMIALPASLGETTADAGAPIRQIAADAYEAIKAIAGTAMEKIQNTGATPK